VIGGEQVRVPVTIDGKTVDAMLDSGAGLSILRAEPAQRLGVTPAALAGDPDITVRGVGAGVVGVRLHRFDAVAVGAMPIGPFPIAVGEAEFGSADMLLGLDFPRTRRVWLSYRTERLFVQ
jgi:predicted aspartyl protease